MNYKKGMATMNNSAFFVIGVIALFALILGVLIAWFYYNQQRELIEKSVKKDSLLPTSLSEVKGLNLDQTESGRELLAELIKPAIPADELERAISDKNNFTEIAVWGTPASGKSSLFMAFSASIYKYYQLSDVAYQLYNADNYEPVNPFWTPLMPRATERPTDTEYIFTRQFSKGFKGASVSSHSHHLILWDDKGENLMSVINDADNYKITAKRMSSADGIIVTLNPASISSESNRTRPFYSYSRPEYLQIVSNLIDFVQKNNPTCYWAFCLTKMDLYPTLVKNEPWDVLREIFGQELHDFIKAKLPAENVEIFITSALGFTKEKEPNYDYATGSLALANEWEPYNVEFPFFWIFEKLEIKRLSKIKTGFLSKNPVSEYLQYPIPKSRRTPRAPDGQGALPLP
jgi:hypothetical protein